MATFYNTFNHKTIHIPQIQRDYVQALDRGIIMGFTESLINAVQAGNKLNLNYLYGIGAGSNGSFVPIDGQQRLTTLWLLHLYISVQADEVMDIRLEYLTREYAQDFCTALQENRLVLKDSGVPSEVIPDLPWFISSWKKDVTVLSILQALDVIQNNLRGTDCKSLWGSLVSPDCPICFSFKETSDLGDDIYIKMNGRGRSLTPFENLKSWMDGRLEELMDSLFLTDWQRDIDNDWTDLFWRNRDKNDKEPEEISDEQIRFFYTVLYLYWIRKSNDERRAMVSEGERDTSDLRRILGIGDEENIVDVILARLRRSSGFELPLYFLDKTNLFDMGFFTWIAQILDGLAKYEAEINLLDQADDTSTYVRFWNKPATKEPITLLCQILFEEKVEKDIPYAKLALAYAVCVYVTSSHPYPVHVWMYRMRNLIVNTTIDRDNINKVLKSIDELSCASDLDSADYTQYKAFDNAQTKEENAKNIINSSKDESLIESLRKLENHPFFMGQVRFALENLGTDVMEGYTSAFVRYASMLELLFTEDGLNPELEKELYLVHRALLCLSDKDNCCYGLETSYGWSFLKTKDEWKRYLKDPKAEGWYALDRLVRYLISKGNSTIMGIADQLQKLIRDTQATDWRQYFIGHVGVWRYMQSNLYARFEDEYTIFLMRSSVFRSNTYRAGLRSYSMYLQLRKELAEMKDGWWYVNAWWLAFWYEEQTCTYLELALDDGKIAIDIPFDSKTASTEHSENAFRVQLFIRPKDDNETEEETAARRKILLKPYSVFTEKMTEQGARYTTQPLSAAEAVEWVKAITSMAKK